MKIKKLNAAHVWKQLEDSLAPRLRFTTTDRVVYYHLLRHSRLEGKLRLRFSMPWLARGSGLTPNPVRWSVRRLIARGVLRLVHRTTVGHVVDVLLPAEIRAVRLGRMASKQLLPVRDDSFNEEQDFLKRRALRNAIHERERGFCFYCRRRLTSAMRCLDHVVPRVELQDNSYRNLVSCCVECNSHKRGRSAAELLRSLHRERRLTTAELARRFRALDALAAGKLRPQLPAARA